MARVIDQVLGATTSSVVGEITRELVNASDGAGLHFDGAAGGINLGSSMPDLGTKYSLEFVVKGDSKTGVIYLLDAYNSSSTNRVILAWSGSSTGNIQLRINGTWSNAFIATPDNGEVVHLLLSVDGTSATLYQNGKSVSTQTVVANALTGATNTHIGTTQNGTGSFFNGTIYRCRFYNKALSSAEVQTAYERADVDFADQYGRQAVNDGGFTSASNWLTNGGWSVSGNKANFTDGGGTGRVGQNSVFTAADVGKNVHITFTVSTNTGLIWIGNSSGTLQYVDGGYNSYAVGTHTVSFTLPSGGSTSLGIYSQDAAVGNFEISNLGVHVEGAVVDLDLAFANPTQSLTVQDRSTNGVDGTASSSTAVKQVQPVVQLNATAARIGTTAATPANGELLASGNIGSGSADPNIGGWGNAITIDNSGAAALEFAKSGTLYGFVGVQGSGSGNAFDVAAYQSQDMRFRVGLNAGTTALTIDQYGNAIFKKDTGAYLQLSDASAVRGSIHCTTSDGLVFSTGAGFAQRMTIASTGDVSYGVGNSKEATIQSTNAGRVEGNPAYSFRGDLDTGMFNPNTDNTLAFSTGGTERMRIDSSGLATFSDGIAFSQTNTSATGATATGTTLDHYESGSWTPSLSPGSGSFTTLTYTTQRGRYIRVGSQVWCGFEISVNSFTIGTGASYVSLDGLPFSRPALEDQYGSGVVTQYSGWTNAAPTLLPRNGTASCILRYGFSATTVTNLSPANITNGCVMNGFVTFSV